VDDSKLRLLKPKLTNHPVDVGLRTEAAILSELIQRGYSILVPWGVNQRYDLVVDLDGEFVRAQCKTGRIRNGTIEFNTRSVQCNMRRVVARDYAGDIDVFLVPCSATPLDVYCVPVEIAGSYQTSLRIEPTLNGQAQRIHWASDYLLPA
jgi:hypothetical protein